MGRNRIAGWALAVLMVAGAASAHTGHLHREPGSLVGVSVEVGGRHAPLHPAPDGSGRYYLEAREGASYLIHLSNRTSERLGVVLAVDGLNAISGERDRGRGRMYILDPWREATVRGWRTSLQEVRRFTFVDERSSYAARSGKANSRMGWIEVSVFRERRPRTRIGERDDDAGRAGEPFEESGRAEPAPAPTADAAGSEAGPLGKSQAGARKRSYPGTGWGSRAHDPVVVVDFEPERSPAERTTLRYEYRRALVDLGVLPSPHARHDRLHQRDLGEPGFAQPPKW
ncbi:MAG: hypothetical protein LJF30_06735 [Acidobacteria bacterium]|nr:hypothetical protein [Acidobacteriota bacterium]